MSNDEPVATYRTPAHLFWMAAILGTLIAVPMMHAALTIEATTFQNALNRWIIVAIGLGLLVLAYAAANMRTRIFNDRVEKIGAFSRRTLHARDIAGFRDAIHQGYIRLIPDAPHLLPMRVPRDIRQCADRVTWVDKLIDLEDADRRALDRTVLSNPRFGATEGHRLAFVGKAKRRVLALTLASPPAVAWGLIWPEPRALVVAVLALIPLLSIAVALHARPAIRVAESDRRRGKLDLFLALGLPSIVLMLMAGQAALIDRPSAALLAVGAATACALAWLDPLLHRRWLALVILAGVGFCYARGVAIEANILLDSATATRKEVTVREKRVEGRVFERPALIVSPWVDRGVEHEIPVSRALHDAVAVGDRVCITVHPGALGLRWYEVVRCN